MPIQAIHQESHPMMTTHHQSMNRNPFEDLRKSLYSIVAILKATVHAMRDQCNHNRSFVDLHFYPDIKVTENDEKT
ncbi:MAG TPA: hypothetical protein DEA86_02680 [Deltaproteobacteria bacterium]|jgi:hypothetical protein|nr:hypothetical protein [Deltaproteobacteria bacterium]